MKRPWAAALAAFLVGCAAPVRTDIPTAPSPAPRFSLFDLSGATVKISDFQGKVVLVDFWATWCEPCKQSIPRYIRMQEKLRDKGFAVVGIDEDEKPEIAAAYARNHSMNYPVLLDPGTGLFAEFGGASLPAAFLIDAQGQIRGHWEGFDAATGQDVERAADALLGIKPRL
jgi:thiol-disulfide isomerase/thioredoxin